MNVRIYPTVMIILLMYTTTSQSMAPFYDSCSCEYIEQINKNITECLEESQSAIAHGLQEKQLTKRRNHFLNLIEQAHQENSLMPQTCRHILCEYHYYRQEERKLPFIDHILFNKIRPFIINKEMIHDDYREFLSCSAGSPLLINELFYKYKLLHLHNNGHTPIKRFADTIINGINLIIGNKIKNLNSSLLEKIITAAYDYGFMIGDTVCVGQDPLFETKRPIKPKHLKAYIHSALQPKLYNDTPVHLNLSATLQKQMISLTLSLKIGLKNIKVPKVLLYYIMDYLKKYNEACHMKSLICTDIGLIKKPYPQKNQQIITYLKSEKFLQWFDAQAIT